MFPSLYFEIVISGIDVECNRVWSRIYFGIMSNEIYNIYVVSVTVRPNLQ